MKTLIALAFILAALPAFAQSPSFIIVSDPVAANVTHCGFFLDSMPKVTLPVVPDPGGAGNICQFDLAGVSNGAHVLIATAIVQSTSTSTGGESDPSTPFSFNVTGSVNAPTGQHIKVK